MGGVMRACFGWESRNKPVFFIISLYPPLLKGELLNLLPLLKVKRDCIEKVDREDSTD
jgi:hypothetical protein